MSGRRPAITAVGTVSHDGTHLLIRGWSVGLCLARCSCHFYPTSGKLYVLEDDHRGLLGLQSYVPIGAKPCPCCSPWTVEELRLIVRDLADIASLGEAAAAG